MNSGSVGRRWWSLGRFSRRNADLPGPPTHRSGTGSTIMPAIVARDHAASVKILFWVSR